jgi:hypothetical protein
VDSCGFIKLDGFIVPGRFLFGQGITSRGGVRASKSTERPFMFQKVKEIGISPVPFFLRVVLTYLS